MAAALPYSALLLLLLLLTLSIFHVTESALSVDYYNTTCPKFEKIVLDAVTTKQINNPTTAAGIIRLFFHDCMVEGCDASVLIASNSVDTAERDADINLSLSGDAFDVVTRAKTALEVACPNTVSCADILALAARDLTTMVGGPFYKVRLGRKDGLVSKSSRVEGNLPRTNMTMNRIIKLFRSRGLTVQDMVALNGAHTIGFSHCKEFAGDIFPGGKRRPANYLNPQFAAALRKFCGNYTEDPTLSVFNDVYTPGKFDNMYYRNVKKGMGILSSDMALLRDPRTAPLMEMYAKNQSRFFEDYAAAMEKFSGFGVKTGKDGEVRRRCDNFNSFAISEGGKTSSVHDKAMIKGIN